MVTNNPKGGKRRNYTSRKSACKVFRDDNQKRRAAECIPLDRYLQRVTLGEDKRVKRDG